MNYLSNLSWNFRDSVDKVKIIDYEDSPELDNVMDSIFSKDDFLLEVAIHRDSESHFNISFEGGMTIRQILQRIYDFYHLEEVIEDLIENSPNDVFDYQKEVMTKLKNGGRANWIEMMGDMTYFEGFRKKSPKSYYLILGS